MAEKIIMPQGGQDLKFGTVVRWFKHEGEQVIKDEMVCEVETEKAVFEVTSPCTGTLLKIIKQDGEEAEVLSAIGYVGNPEEKISFDEEPSAKQELIHTVSSNQRADQPAVSGKAKISPKARKLARDYGIDITSLKSSRSDGKITTEDVEEAISGQSVTPAETVVAGGRMVPMKKISGIAAKKLAESWNQAPHFYVTVSVDMTNALCAREEMNASSKDSKISINDLVINAVVLALKNFPRINASYHDEDTIIEWDSIHIGIATASADGLLVPVLENADQLSILQISQQVKKITKAAREGKQLSSSASHFTISNLGMYQVDRFSAIINPPEAAILAVASVQKKAIVNEKEEIAIRDMMEITLSLDHRIGDGVLAAEFIHAIKANLEDIRTTN